MYIDDSHLIIPQYIMSSFEYPFGTLIYSCPHKWEKRMNEGRQEVFYAKRLLRQGNKFVHNNMKIHLETKKKNKNLYELDEFFLVYIVFPPKKQ